MQGISAVTEARVQSASLETEGNARIEWPHDQENNKSENPLKHFIQTPKIKDSCKSLLNIYLSYSLSADKSNSVQV